MSKAMTSGCSTQLGAGISGPLTPGVTIFTGRFGGGKTETAINYAVALVGESEPKARDSTVRAVQSQGINERVWASAILIDLDIVTPYFRSREVAEALQALGVLVVTPKAVGQHLDVPAIAPEILGAIEQSRLPVVLDVGGDRQGARALGQFSGAICQRDKRDRVCMHFVVNPYRPFTGTAEGLVSSIAEIEASARLQVTSLVSNPNLMGDTTPEVILEGHRRVKAFARVLELPIAFVCIERRWAADFGTDGSAKSAARSLDSPVLVMDRHFAMSWE